MGKVAETPSQAEAGTLKRDVCAAKGDCLLFRVPRADRPAEIVWSAPARVGEREFHGGSACGVLRKFITLALAGAGNIPAFSRRASVCAASLLWSLRGGGRMKNRGSPGMRASAVPTLPRSGRGTQKQRAPQGARLLYMRLNDGNGRAERCAVTTCNSRYVPRLFR